MKEITVLHKIWEHAQHTPTKTSLFDQNWEITYGQQKQAIMKCAAYFADCGIKKGERIAAGARQSISFLVTVSAIHLLGAVVIPLEKNLSSEKILDIMKRLESNWLVCYNDMELPGITILSANVIEKHIFVSNETVMDFPLPTPEMLADILFTTGTTGIPKGIEISHLANRAIAENVIDSVALQEDDIELIPTPVNHSLGLRRYYGAMYRGSTVGIMNGVIYTDDFFDMIRHHHVTAVTLVPAMLSILLRFSRERLQQLNTQLRFIQLGSAPATEADKKELCRLLPEVHLYNTYGATEAGCACIFEFNQHKDKKFCIGRPTVNTVVSFVDEGRNVLRCTSKNNPGRIALEGPMIMNGYWKDSQMTSEVLQNGRIYTNDIGYRGEDGYIYLLGREGDIINSGGNKIAPTEIEEMVLCFSKIAECACVSAADEIAGEILKLFVVMKQGEIFCEQEILSFLNKWLEPFKIPKCVEELKELPRAYNGKILRDILKKEQRNI